MLRQPGRPPRLDVGSTRDGGLGAVQPVQRRLHVDPGPRRQHEPERVPPFERTGAEDPPQLRQQRRQRRIDSPGRLVAPDCVDDLVACARLGSIHDQVGEQQPALPARKLLLDPPAVERDRQSPAEMDSDFGQGFAKLRPSVPSDNGGVKRREESRWPS